MPAPKAVLAEVDHVLTAGMMVTVRKGEATERTGKNHEITRPLLVDATVSRTIEVRGVVGNAPPLGTWTKMGTEIRSVTVAETDMGTGRKSETGIATLIGLETEIATVRGIGTEIVIAEMTRIETEIETVGRSGTQIVDNQACLQRLRTIARSLLDLIPVGTETPQVLKMALGSEDEPRMMT